MIVVSVVRYITNGMTRHFNFIFYFFQSISFSSFFSKVQNKKDFMADLKKRGGGVNDIIHMLGRKPPLHIYICIIKKAGATVWAIHYHICTCRVIIIHTHVCALLSGLTMIVSTVFPANGGLSMIGVGKPKLPSWPIFNTLGVFHNLLVVGRREWAGVMHELYSLPYS